MSVLHPPILPQKLFEEQLKKYDQLRVYLEQNLAAQDNVLRALTEANVQYAAVRRVLNELDQKSVPGPVLSPRVLPGAQLQRLPPAGSSAHQMELHPADPGGFLRSL